MKNKALVLSLLIIFNISIVIATDCQDFDNGKTYFLKSHAIGDWYGGGDPKIYGQDPNPSFGKPTSDSYSTYYDWCTGLQLMEAICDANGKLSVASFSCPNGCYQGACKCQTNSDCPQGYVCRGDGFTCVEGEDVDCYDDGNDYFTKQKVQIRKNGIIVSTNYDRCEGNILNEAYCQDPHSDDVSFLTYTCPDGCSEGACLKIIQCTESWSCSSWSSCINGQQTRTCTDTNNCGTTLSRPPLSQSCTVSNEKPDFSVNGLEISSASDAPKEGNYDRNIFVKIFNSGKEIVPGYLSYEIKVKDENGNDIDSCIMNSYLNWFSNKEAIVKGGSCSLNLPAGKLTFVTEVDVKKEYNELNENNNIYTQKIEILSEDYKCKDSDGGKNFNVKGEIEGYLMEELSIKTFKDTCENVNKLKEYDCQNDGAKIGYVYENCQYGCKDGVCLTESIPTTTPTQSEEPESVITEDEYLKQSCDGCLMEDNCVSYGTRLDEKYCSLSKDFLNQRDLGSSCNENYECKSNECLDRECVSTYGLLKRIWVWIKNLFN